ncbi:DUF397 domain-containing protein [Nocardiopsis nanhaiensis]
MNTETLSPWHTSSYSTAQSNCVAVATTPLGRAVRDSQHPELGDLNFPREQWIHLLAYCKILD